MYITIMPNGTLKFIYDDQLKPLLSEGKAIIKRVSHVEPTPDNRWQADLSPVVPGTILGPYNTRREALQAEVEWINNNLEKIK